MLKTTWILLRSHYYNKRNNKSPEDYYRGKFAIISNFFADKDFNEENVDLFFEFLKKKFREKNNKSISHSYYNKFLSMLKVIGKKEGVTFVDEYKAKNEQEDADRTEKMTLEECERFFSISRYYGLNKNSEYRNFFFNVIAKTLIITACRPGSLRLIEWSDLKEGYLSFKKIIKNGRPYKIRLPENILNSITKLKKYPHNFIFSNDERGPFDLKWLNKEIQFRLNILGINKKITSKSFRGTGAIMYLKKNHLHQVKHITNHRSADVLANHYYDPAQEEIENIVKYNPLSPDKANSEFLQQYIYKIEKELKKYGCSMDLAHCNKTKEWSLKIKYP